MSYFDFSRFSNSIEYDLKVPVPKDIKLEEHLSGLSKGIIAQYESLMDFHPNKHNMLKVYKPTDKHKYFIISLDTNGILFTGLSHAKEQSNVDSFEDATVRSGGDAILGLIIPNPKVYTLSGHNFYIPKSKIRNVNMKKYKFHIKLCIKVKDRNLFLTASKLFVSRKLNLRAFIRLENK